MEPQQVIDKILTEAQNEAAEIRQRAERQQAAEQTKFDNEISRYEEQTQQLAKQAAEAEKAQILAMTRMDAGKAYLSEKTRILDDIFARSRRQLREMPDDEYRQLMKRLLSEAVETGNEEVIAGEDDSRLDQGLIDEVNGMLKEQDKGGLKLSSERHQLGGGFILRRGRIQTNVTTDVLVGQSRGELEIELSKELFGDGGNR